MLHSIVHVFPACEICVDETGDNICSPAGTPDRKVRKGRAG